MKDTGPPPFIFNFNLFQLLKPRENEGYGPQSLHLFQRTVMGGTCLSRNVTGATAEKTGAERSFN